MSEEASMGYWKDVVGRWSERYKRRKTSAAVSPAVAAEDFSSLSSPNQNEFNFTNHINRLCSEKKETEQKAATEWLRKKEKKEKVAYPFAVLKPTEVEGKLTLAEINERILRRPRRPVRHPVGEFACLPWVVKGGDGPGLSGKAVVGVTRVCTKGKGSITVIRTRGLN
ncbi:uncharacterized protein LOC110020093 [Phalaenopsis equestris]|uniref:uncharacterized protein LOC110020093 n=1 Tax=Phalaenopsis equestris TaxID=78828 RepID=UPI0009E57AC1|nr:uncharacterized protein LOC110020093 [Phalaenopsis equestris]XP_020573730.1 uncharacterized protein LOC110020093 [Phalaenopsis equestris]